MKNFLLGTMLVGMVACGGGGGNGDGTATLTHNELANIFVGELNLDTDFDVDLVKSSTLQENYLVIYDPLTDSYDAINIDLYDPDLDNASDYYYDNASAGYFDLDFIPDYPTGTNSLGSPVFEDVYEDYSTGLIFEKTTATAKDLAKVAALKEAHKVQRSAEYLSSSFGLSVARGKEIAKLTNHWKKTSKKGMTAAETDKFAAELLGFTLSKGVTAYKDSLAGDSTALDSLIDEAASANNITPEHATQLMTQVFGL